MMEKTIEFPATGVRDKSLRSTELPYVEVSSHGIGADPSWIRAEKDTYPAFRVLTYISSSTMGDSKKQVSLFYIDGRIDDGVNCLTTSSSSPRIGSYHGSADAYGLTVRPMLERANYGAATP